MRTEFERVGGALGVLKDQALDAAVNGVVIGDAAQAGFPIVYVNAGFERITGYARADVLGRPCSLLQGPDSDPAAVDAFTRALRRGQECRTTILNYRKDGSKFWNEVYLSPVFDSDGQLSSYIGIQNDVTEQREAEDEVKRLAFHDELTGLPNRAQLRRGVERAIQRAGNGGLAAALLYLDLDDFKRVNDTLGHEAGDELLVLVAERLRGALPVRHLIARQGGDEFLILTADIKDDPRSTAERISERVLASLGPAFEVAGQELSVRASVGVSVFPDDAADSGALMRHADTAMYAAKRSGGGYRFSRGDNAAAEPTEIGPPQRASEPSHDAELERVLAARAIEPVFQPIVDLRTREPIAYEALARGPEDSPLHTPGPLFTAAARAGRLAELDWICRVRSLESVRAAGVDPEFTVFVNAEPETLASPCPDDLLESWGEGHPSVFVEITERALTSRPAELLGEVERIRARGWGIALDDVGADVRSLALMPLLRPDVIKLDLRLVQAQPTTEIASIVNAVRAEQERTGAAVIAEGIETEAHFETALALGATLGQGWLFGRPARWARPA